MFMTNEWSITELRFKGQFLVLNLFLRQQMTAEIFHPLRKKKKKWFLCHKTVPENDKK